MADRFITFYYFHSVFVHGVANGCKWGYKRSWSLFVAWAQAYLGNCNFNLPLQPAVLALFVSHLYSLRYASSTVTSYLSAISYAHRLAGVNDPTETALIRQTLKGYSKLTPAQDVHLPITLLILSQIIVSFQHTTGSAYQLQLPTAMCSLAFFAFLHIDEITVNGKDHNNLIRLPQLESLVNDKRQVIALQLTILQYKHSNNRRPFTIYIHKEVSCCLVKAILDYASTRGSFNGPLFCWPDGRPSLDPFLWNNSIEHFEFAISILLCTNHTVSEKAQRLGPLLKVFLTHRFASWADGNLMHF